MNSEEVKKAALEFLKKHKGGVLATVSSSGAPQAALVYYVCDDSFCIYFSTLNSTRKFTALSKDPRAAFTVTAIDTTQTLQIEGTVSEVTEEETIKADLASLIGVLESNNTYYWPITKMHGGRVVLMKLTPAWVRWGDFTLQQEKEIFTEIPVR